jgi:uncharacterized protein YkuJ
MKRAFSYLIADFGFRFCMRYFSLNGSKVQPVLFIKQNEIIFKLIVQKSDS